MSPKERMNKKIHMMVKIRGFPLLLEVCLRTGGATEGQTDRYFYDVTSGERFRAYKELRPWCKRMYPNRETDILIQQITKLVAKDGDIFKEAKRKRLTELKKEGRKEAKPKAKKPSSDKKRKRDAVKGTGSTKLSKKKKTQEGSGKPPKQKKTELKTKQTKGKKSSGASSSTSESAKRRTKKSMPKSREMALQKIEGKTEMMTKQDIKMLQADDWVWAFYTGTTEECRKYFYVQVKEVGTGKHSGSLKVYWEKEYPSSNLHNIWFRVTQMGLRKVKHDNYQTVENDKGVGIKPNGAFVMPLFPDICTSDTVKICGMKKFVSYNGLIGKVVSKETEGNLGLIFTVQLENDRGNVKLRGHNLVKLVSGEASKINKSRSFLISL